MVRVLTAFEPVWLGEATGWGLGGAQRAVRLLSGRCDWRIRQVADCRAHCANVVVGLLFGQHRADLGKRGEQRLIEQFVAQSAV